MSNVVIIGGSSGIGRAVAQLLASRGAHVTVASRSVGGVDIRNETDVRRFFEDHGPVDHVVVTAMDTAGAYGPVRDLDPAAALAAINVKVIGALLIAKHAGLRPGGSLTLTSGIAAYRPAVGGAVIAAANGALESLAKALALELAPVRVNVVSPGWIDTPVWDTLAGPAKHDRQAAMAERLPGRRIGHPDDVAKAVVALLDNEFVTGSVFQVDGGQRLV